MARMMEYCQTCNITMEPWQMAHHIGWHKERGDPPPRTKRVEIRKTSLEQALEARMMDVQGLLEIAEGHLTGKAIREQGERPEEQGEIIGRFRGVLGSFPELAHLGNSPKQILAALKRGRGVIFKRIVKAMTYELSKRYDSRRKRSPGRPVVPGHTALSKKCRHCGVMHSKDRHRFHGQGAFHSTHAFSFPKLENPKNSRQIYGRVIRIEAQKIGPHACDAECRKCQHKYFHDFKRRAKMIGLKPGDVVRIPAGQYPLLVIGY